MSGRPRLRRQHTEHHHYLLNRLRRLCTVGKPILEAILVNVKLSPALACTLRTQKHVQVPMRSMKLPSRRDFEFAATIQYTGFPCARGVATEGEAPCSALVHLPMLYKVKKGTLPFFFSGNKSNELVSKLNSQALKEEHL